MIKNWTYIFFLNFVHESKKIVLELHPRSGQKVIFLVVQFQRILDRKFFFKNSFKKYQILFSKIMSSFFLNPVSEIAEVSVGQHFYWQVGPYEVHGQVLLMSWFVLGLIFVLSFAANSNLKSTPDGLQNFTEFVTEFIRDLAKTQIGEEEYLKWVPYLGTVFLFIFVSNWSGALLPWRVIELPHGELAAPTNDINTTVALALLTSISYFYAGIRKKGLGYFKRYVQPAAFLLPINVLEDFTKPLSLSFRLIWKHSCR